MSMVLEANNVRRLRHVRLPIEEGVTFLAGPNRAGKTSLLTALGALLSGERAPLTGVIKFDAERIVQRGEKEARATLVDPDANWGVAVVWRKASGTAELTTNGRPPTCSRLCAGLDLFSNLDRTARLKLLAGVLKAAPTVDHLRASCPLASDAALDKLRPQVEAGLWDDAHATADGEAKQAMGAWRQVAGQTWTNKGGKEWQPEGLPEAGLRTLAHLEQLRAQAVRLKALAATARTGITAEERATLKALAAEEAQAKSRLVAFEAELASYDVKRQEAQLALGQTRKPGTAPPTCACPACGTVLDVSAPLSLKEAGRANDKAEQAALKKAWQEAQAAETRASSAYSGMRHNVDVAREYLDRCQTAAARLEEIGGVDDRPLDDGDTRDLTAARLEDVLVQVKALRAWLDASELHERVRMWVELRGQLAPDGLRRVLLTSKLAEFNRRLAAWAPDLDGLVIRIDEDMMVRDGGDEPYRILSGAEKWLSDVLVMLAIAEIEGAPVVVVDESNLLDERLRPALLAKVLARAAAQRRIVVACAIGFADKAPQLAKWRLGQTFWVEEGGLVEDYQPARAAAGAAA